MENKDFVKIVERYVALEIVVRKSCGSSLRPFYHATSAIFDNGLRGHDRVRGMLIIVDTLEIVVAVRQREGNEASLGAQRGGHSFSTNCDTNSKWWDIFKLN